jgi:hypothetical protein
MAAPMPLPPPVINTERPRRLGKEAKSCGAPEASVERGEGVKSCDILKLQSINDK